MAEDDVSRERQEYLDRRRRLKELERQKLIKGKNGGYLNGSKDNNESKAGHQSKGHGGSTSRGDARPAPSKKKDKLPYDRSFGSFFGPSEPVVAKRIIEEARAREEAEIVAARAAKVSREEAKARHEAEQRKKSGGGPSTGKSSHDDRSTKRPAKPVDKVTEKARKLKEARDYSFLREDSPLPDPKPAEKKVPTSRLGDGRHESGKSAPVRSDNTPTRKPILAPPGNSIGTSRSDKPTSFSRPSSSQLRSSQPSRALPSQSTRDHSFDNKSAIQNRTKGTSSGKPLSSKMPSAVPDRSNPRKDANSKEAVMRKLVGGSTTSNGTKSSSMGKRPTSLHGIDRRPTQGMDRRPSHAADRRLVAQPTERQPPTRPIERSSHGRPSERQGAQVGDRRAATLQAPQRHPGAPQGSKKGAPVTAAYRPAVGGAEPRRQMSAAQAGRQSSQLKPAPKGSSGPATDYKRKTVPRDEIQRKRARSLSEESDDRPVRKKAVQTKMARHGGRIPSPSEEDDDSFIDDEDEGANVSSMIHKLMGYNPNKYRGNDDFDDRSMEVGFRTIQAEELRSAREARLEDERELALIEAEEREEERRRKARKKRKLANR